MIKCVFCHNVAQDVNILLPCAKGGDETMFPVIICVTLEVIGGVLEEGCLYHLNNCIVYIGLWRVNFLLSGAKQILGAVHVVWFRCHYNEILSLD